MLLVPFSSLASSFTRTDGMIMDGSTGSTPTRSNNRFVHTNRRGGVQSELRVSFGPECERWGGREGGGEGLAWGGHRDLGLARVGQRRDSWRSWQQHRLPDSCYPDCWPSHVYPSVWRRAGKCLPKRARCQLRDRDKESLIGDGGWAVSCQVPIG
jgi:hypothetical protein